MPVDEPAPESSDRLKSGTRMLLPDRRCVGDAGRYAFIYDKAGRG